MDGALRDALAVLMRDQLVVLEQHRPARTGGDGILIVGDRRAGGGQGRFLGHMRTPHPKFSGQDEYGAP